MQKDGVPLSLEILVENGPFEQKAITDIYAEGLERLGIDPSARAETLSLNQFIDIATAIHG